MTLRIGQPAPDFDVTAADGRRLHLAELLRTKQVVLYFYPEDFTAVCTRETCGFRDAIAELADADTEVIGVSHDDDATHRRFAAEYQVPFALVSDPRLALAKRYQATSLLLGLAGKSGRVTYVIDRAGVIVGAFDGLFNAAHHVDGVRALVRRRAASAT